MAKSGEKFEIRIESILGGHSVAQFFAEEDQFQTSLGIDPGIYSSGYNLGNYKASGLIVPVACTDFSQTLVSAPMWMNSNPKDGNIYVSDYAGSVYTIAISGQTVTELGDLNDGGTSQGNGQEYYDNYIYFSRSTSIARYGPLDGTAAFTDDYWVGTLGKTALTNTSYPKISTYSNQLPNHVLKRHSDGKLYFADVVGNQGYLHYIKTTKTTVEGDTDDGSTYQKLAFGYGLWPTAIESYGSDLVIALYEGSNNQTKEGHAKIAFWDTTSDRFYQIIWEEFPDTIITGLKNINGTLYIFSCNTRTTGVRVSQYVGGNSIKELIYLPESTPPFPGAIDGEANRLLFGSSTTYPETASCVFSIGLQNNNLSNGVFCVMRGTESGLVTSLKFVGNNPFTFNLPIIGLGTGRINSSNASSLPTASPPVWWSKIYRIGRQFKITKVRIPLVDEIGANVTLIPKLYIDIGSGLRPITLQTINSTNYPAGDNSNGSTTVVLRPEGAVGFYSFFLELRWTGNSGVAVGLPITIEYEILHD